MISLFHGSNGSALLFASRWCFWSISFGIIIIIEANPNIKSWLFKSARFTPCTKDSSSKKKKTSRKCVFVPFWLYWVTGGEQETEGWVSSLFVRLWNRLGPRRPPVNLDNAACDVTSHSPGKPPTTLDWAQTETMHVLHIKMFNEMKMLPVVVQIALWWLYYKVLFVKQGLLWG